MGAQTNSPSEPEGVGAGNNNGKSPPTQQEGFSASFGSPVGQCFNGSPFTSESK